MTAMRIVGVLLLVLGLTGFLTGGFSFTKDTTQAKLGPLELTVKEKETINVPQWLSLGAMVLGRGAGVGFPQALSFTDTSRHLGRLSAGVLRAGLSAVRSAHHA